MECTLIDLKRMRKSDLVIEAVRLQKDKEYGKSEAEKMKKELEEVHEEMKFQGKIDDKMWADIKEMHILRNRVVYGYEGEVDMEIAVSFIKQTFDISKNIAENLLIEQN